MKNLEFFEKVIIILLKKSDHKILKISLTFSNNARKNTN